MKKVKCPNCPFLASTHDSLIIHINNLHPMIHDEIARRNQEDDDKDGFFENCQGDKKMKLTNSVLEEALELEETIRKASKRLAEIKEEAKHHGSFSTREFVVSVTEQERETLAGKAEFFAFYDRGELEKHGLLRRTTAQIVRIARKVAA